MAWAPVRSALRRKSISRVMYGTRKLSQGSDLWTAGWGCASMSQEVEGDVANGLQDLDGALQLLHPRTTSDLHYAHYRTNQINVMYGGNAMDFPSTYGLSLSWMTQKRRLSSSKSEWLELLSSHGGKGHTYSRSLQLMSGLNDVSLKCDVWGICLSVLTDAI